MGRLRTGRVPHLVSVDGEPERWKWTICHFPSRRCHTLVSSDWAVRGVPLASMYCVTLMYAMQAASSPTRWMWGFRMVVWTGLLFLDHTERVERVKVQTSETPERGKLHPGSLANSQFSK